MAAKTILVVDDDRDVVLFLKSALEADGWRVLSEQDGDWAIKTFQSTHVDAVVLDILLPVKSGLDVAREIRRDPRGKETPIVLLSGVYRSDEHRREAMEQLGLLGYLNKPVESRALRKLLKDHFGENYPQRVKGRGRALRRTYSMRLADAAARLSGRDPTHRPKPLQDGNVKMEGDLSDTAFGRVLHELYRVEATGALFMLRGKVKKVIYFMDGRPVYAKSNLLGECLGRMLVAEGIITEEECEESVIRMKQAGRLQGAELVLMGLLSHQDLVMALQRQLELKILDIFGWKSGLYRFKENVALSGEPMRLATTIATLVYRGLVAGKGNEDIEKERTRFESGYVAPASDPVGRFQVMELEERSERRVLELVDGTRTLKLLVEESGLDPERAARIALAAVHSGMAELWDMAVPMPPLLRPGESSFPEGLEEREVQKHLAADLVALTKRSAFQILGIGIDADAADVEEAFFRIAKTYHPDRYLKFDDATKELARTLFDTVVKAHRLVRDKGAGASDVRPFDGRSLVPSVYALAASRHYEEGQALLAQGKFLEAADSFGRAVDLAPENGVFLASLAWASYQAEGPEALERTLGMLQEAIRFSPDHDRAYLYLGLVEQARGNLEKAGFAFQQALRCNPECDEAILALDELGIPT